MSDDSLAWLDQSPIEREVNNEMFDLEEAMNEDEMANEGQNSITVTTESGAAKADAVAELESLPRWEVVEGAHSNHVRIGDAFTIKLHWNGTALRSEMDAIYRLIAAGPDLFAALELVLPRLAHKAKCHSVRPTEEWQEHGSSSYENCSCGIGIARAAVAKATGKEVK